MPKYSFYGLFQKWKMGRDYRKDQERIAEDIVLKGGRDKVGGHDQKQTHGEKDGRSGLTQLF